MTSVNDILQDQIIHHSAVDLMKIETTQRRKVLKMMKSLERDLTMELLKHDPTGSPKSAIQTKRIQALLKQTRTTIRGYTSGASKVLEKDLYDLAEAESAFTEGALNAAMGAEVASVAISPSRLKAMAGRTLVEGRFPAEWWGKQSTALQDKFTTEMRKGMGRGETVGELSRRIRKNVMPAARRNAEAMARTSAMAVIQEARQESYKQVSDIIKGYKYTATLDGRTTPYCRAADGTVMKKNFAVVSGPTWVKPPPNHWNCRSTLSPITKSWAELEAQYKGTKTMDKLDPIPTKTRASMDGKAPRDIKYTDWLKGQPKSMQNDILGVTRADLFRRGKITDMTQLLDQTGDLLTIQELKSAMASGKLVDPITGKLFTNTLSKRGKRLAAEVAAKRELESTPPDKESVEVFTEESDAPVSEFPPIDKPSKVKSEVWEPDWEETGKAKASGIILFDENTDKVFIVEPKGHFGGYKHTFPKGRLKSGLTAQESALEELWEESGMGGEVLDYLGSYEKTVTTSRYYVARRGKGSPIDFGDETQSVKIMPRSKLKEYLNKDIDKGIAEDFDALWLRAIKEGDGDATTGFRRINAKKHAADLEKREAKAEAVARELEKAKAEAEARVKAEAVARVKAKVKAEAKAKAEASVKVYKDTIYKEAVEEYTKGAYSSDVGGYSAIQDYLRTGYVSKHTTASRLSDITNKITASIDASPITRERMFYRGVYDIGDALPGVDIKVGEVFNSKGFTSVSTSKTIAKRFAEPLMSKDEPGVIRVFMKKGQKALDIGKVTGDDFEKEFVLNRNSKFKIIKIKKGKVTQIDLELLPQKPLTPINAVTPKKKGISYEQQVSDLERTPQGDSAIYYLQETSDEMYGVYLDATPAKQLEILKSKIEDVKAIELDFTALEKEFMRVAEQADSDGAWSTFWRGVEEARGKKYSEIPKWERARLFAVYEGDELLKRLTTRAELVAKTKVKEKALIKAKKEAQRKAEEKRRKKEEKAAKEREETAVLRVDSLLMDETPDAANAIRRVAMEFSPADDYKAFAKLPATEKLPYMRKAKAEVGAIRRIDRIKDEKHYERLYHIIAEEEPDFDFLPAVRRVELFDERFSRIQKDLIELDDLSSTKMGKEAVEYLSANDAAFSSGDTLSTRLSKVRGKVEELKAADIAAKASKKLTKATSKDKARIKAAKAKVKRYDFSKMEKYGEQAGSNKGGFYKDADGNRYYIKFFSQDRIDNEIAASRLYRAMGADVPDLGVIDSPDFGSGIVSPIIDGVKKDADALLSGTLGGVEDTFLTDAWLANWDVVGASYDNLLVAGGKAVRIDVGGALDFRAQGSMKTWGDVVGEIETLRERVRNPTAGRVFSRVTDEDLKKAALKLNNLTDKDITDIIQATAGSYINKDELISKLLNRRTYLLNRYLPTKPQVIELPTRLPTIKAIRAEKLEGYIKDFDTVTIGKKTYKSKAEVAGKVRQAIKKLRYSKLGKGKLSPHNKAALDLLDDRAKMLLDEDIRILRDKYIPKVKSGKVSKTIDAQPTGSGTGIERGTSSDPWSGDMTPLQDKAYKEVKRRTELTEKDYSKFRGLGFSREEVDDLSDMFYENMVVMRNNNILEEDAPMFQNFMDEGVFKNQFVLGLKATSEGSLDPRKGSGRDSWEGNIYNKIFQKSKRYKSINRGDYMNTAGVDYAKERPDYGWVFDPHRNRAKQYGPVSFVLNDEVKDRTTFTLKNSSGLHYTTSIQEEGGTIRDNKALVLRAARKNSDRLRGLLDKYKSGVPTEVLQDSIARMAYSEGYGYIETQTLGGIKFSRDVKELRTTSHFMSTYEGASLKKLAKRWNIPIVIDNRLL